MAKRYIRVSVGYRKTAVLNLIVDDEDKNWKDAFNSDTREFNGFVPQPAIDNADDALRSFDFVVPEDDDLGAQLEGTQEIFIEKLSLEKDRDTFWWYDLKKKQIVQRNDITNPKANIQTKRPKKKPGKTGPS